jgi:hypothetical protein
MVISWLHDFLIGPVTSTERRDRLRSLGSILSWLALSLGVAMYYGSLGLQRALSSEYAVQDDAREYVFWMQQFVDPTLLPHDSIAQYFKSITPPGYAAIYHAMAIVGIQPLLLSKVLPIVVGSVATLYGFGVCLRLFPVPVAAFLSMVVLNQSLWFKDDLSSATPRAFVYPLFLAFLYYLLRQNRFAVIVILTVQALIYPPLVFIAIALLVLHLWQWDSGKPRFERKRILFTAVAIVVTGLALLPYASASAEFAPVIVRSQAWEMPALHLDGRHPFFNPNPWMFWLFGEHSGIVPPLMPPLIWIGLLLPFMRRFPLSETMKPAIAVLLQIVWVSLGLFIAAHAWLLKLFFPTRYTTHTIRVVMAIAAGIVLTILFDATFRACTALIQRQRWGAVTWRVALTIVVGAVLVLYPQFTPSFPKINYRIAQGEAALYQFLQTQPKDSLIASLSDVGNNIPTFTQRSILVSKEYALPFHLRYYRQISQRSLDLIQAQYRSNLATAQSTIQKYGIDFWLLERSAFTPEYLTKASWLASFQPAYTEALTQLQRGTVPALASLTKRCSVMETDALILLEANCIVRERSATS